MARVETEAEARSARVHWVDWLKVLAVLAIFLYHVALVFSITSWMVSNHEKSLILSAIVGWGYLWGLQLLFVLAGASSYYALRRRSALKFAGERLFRLGIPLLIGFVTLSPLQAYYLALAHGSRQTFGAFLPGYLHRLTFPTDPVWLIRNGYHLWFLGFLLVISLAALPLQWWLDRLPRGLRSRFPADRRWGAAAVLLPVLAIAAFQVALRPAFPPDMSWPDLGSDLVFYLAGYTLAGSPGLAAAVRAAPRRSLLWAVAGWLGLGIAFLLQTAPGWSGGYRPGWLLVGFELARSLGTWGWVLFLAGIAMRYVDRPHPAITYGNEAILPFYVLHHPVVVILAFYIVQLPLGVWPKFALLFTGAFVVTLGIYEVAIRRVGPLRLLFGLSYRRRGESPLRLAGPRRADAVLDRPGAAEA